MTTQRKASDACKEAFIKRGFWPNEVMWACWKDAWQAAQAEAYENAARICLSAPLKTSRQDVREACANAISAAKGEA